jgi:hypothetical protein
MSSRRRHITSFTSTPTSVKTTESRWEFQVSDFGVKVPLLVVGRITFHWKFYQQRLKRNVSNMN